MHAMEFDYTEHVIFSPVPIPEDVVEGLREDFGGRLRMDVQNSTSHPITTRTPRHRGA